MTLTKEQFDRLLELVMLDLEEQEYKTMFNQTDQIIGFIDKLNEVEIYEASGQFAETAKISLERKYATNTIGLTNVEHPVTGNMVQIKFKRGESNA